MALHDVFGLGTVLSRQGRDQRMMGMTFAERIAARPVKRDDQRRPRDKLADERRKGVLIGDAGDFDMEQPGQAQRPAISSPYGSSMFITARRRGFS